MGYWATPRVILNSLTVQTSISGDAPTTTHASDRSIRVASRWRFGAGVTVRCRVCSLGATMKIRHSWLLPRAIWVAARMIAPISTRAAGVLALRLWQVPWTSRASRRHRERVAEVQAQWVATGTIDRYRLPVDTHGDGTAVLVLHGWGEDAASVEPLAAALADHGLRAVTCDLPAHGDSNGNRSDGFQIAEAVQQLVEEEDICAIVAHSMSAMATLHALQEGLDLDAVVLLAPMVRMNDAVGAFAKWTAMSNKVKKGLDLQVEERYGNDVWERLAFDQRNWNSAPPALITHDADDRSAPLDRARALAHAMPQARLVETEQLGHRRLVRDNQVMAEVANFLAHASGTSSAPIATVQ